MKERQLYLYCPHCDKLLSLQVRMAFDEDAVVKPTVFNPLAPLFAELRKDYLEGRLAVDGDAGVIQQRCELRLRSSNQSPAAVPPEPQQP